MSDATSLWEGEVHDGPKCYERMWVNEYGTTMLGYSYTWEKWQSRSHYEVAADPLAAHLATALAAREVELAALRAALVARDADLAQTWALVLSHEGRLERIESALSRIADAHDEHGPLILRRSGGQKRSPGEAMAASGALGWAQDIAKAALRGDEPPPSIAEPALLPPTPDDEVPP